MIRVLLFFLVCPLVAQDGYRMSVVSLVGASAMDAASSWGHREGNPVLRGNEAAYGWQGALIKAGIVSGVLLAERWLLGRHPCDSRLRRTLTYVNYGAAGVTTAVAVRNWRLP